MIYSPKFINSNFQMIGRYLMGRIYLDLSELPDPSLIPLFVLFSKFLEISFKFPSKFRKKSQIFCPIKHNPQVLRKIDLLKNRLSLSLILFINYHSKRLWRLVEKYRTILQSPKNAKYNNLVFARFVRLAYLC